MTDRTCIECGQIKPHAGRSMCSTCYGRARRRGEITDARHRISDLSLEERTGVCSICGPVDVKVRWRDGKLKTECRNKTRADGSRWMRENPSRRSRYRDQVRLSKYGLTDEQYRELERRAGGECMICGDSFEQTPCIDHCHESGEVRRLLCSRCNFALGLLNDDPARALAAHFYLVANGH